MPACSGECFEACLSDLLLHLGQLRPFEYLCKIFPKILFPEHNAKVLSRNYHQLVKTCQAHGSGQIGLDLDLLGELCSQAPT